MSRRKVILASMVIAATALAGYFYSQSNMFEYNSENHFVGQGTVHISQSLEKIAPFQVSDEEMQWDAVRLNEMPNGQWGLNFNNLVVEDEEGASATLYLSFLFPSSFESGTLHTDIDLEAIAELWKPDRIASNATLVSRYKLAGNLYFEYLEPRLEGKVRGTFEFGDRSESSVVGDFDVVLRKPPPLMNLTN